MQRLDPLRLLPLTETIGWRDFEECRRCGDEPLYRYVSMRDKTKGGVNYLRFDSSGPVHVLLRCQNKRMENDMLGRFAEKGGIGMHVHRRAFDECFIAFLRVFARGVSEKARAQRLPDFHSIPSAGNDGVFIPLHDTHELLPDVLGSTHLSRLDEVLEAPWI
jgi:hypothetical protein